MYLYSVTHDVDSKITDREAGVNLDICIRPTAFLLHNRQQYIGKEHYAHSKIV